MANKVPGLSFLNEPYVNRHGEVEKQEDLGLGALGRLFLNMVSPGYYNLILLMNMTMNIIVCLIPPVILMPSLLIQQINFLLMELNLNQVLQIILPTKSRNGKMKRSMSMSLLTLIFTMTLAIRRKWMLLARSDLI